MSLPGRGTATVKVAPTGRVQSIRTPGMTITHPARGPRVIATERNGRTFVSTGRKGGYVQHSYASRHGNNYVQRTYVMNGRTSVSVYRSYSYHSVTYYGYVPPYYYAPRFYGWAYDPWVSPVYFHWGWGGEPWVAPYGYYFTPARYYPEASLWLTDYLLAQNLQAAYQAGQESVAEPDGEQPPPPEGDPGVQPTTQASPLTPEIKQMIASEVKRQLDAERLAAGNPSAPAASQGPPALDPKARVFVVADSIDVVTADGQACSLTAGDVITRIGNEPDDKGVSVMVMSNKKADCPTGDMVAVSLQDLQEMQNHFRQHLDSGLQTLAQDQGKNGLPAAPSTATVAGEVPLPPPDNNVQNQLQQQQSEADQTEKAVQSQVAGQG